MDGGEDKIRFANDLLRIEKRVSENFREQRIHLQASIKQENEAKKEEDPS